MRGGLMTKPLKTRAGGNWTESRYRSFIISALRRLSTRWQPKNESKRNARHFEKLPNPKGRLVFHSVCASCKAIIPETTSSVDHINPVINPSKGFISWDEFIDRLLCESNGFQVLCKPCHDEKTKGERDIGTERKRRERVLTQL